MSCFQELGGAECLSDGCVSVIVNHVVEKCQESRQLAGTLLLRLIAEDLLTIDQFASGSVCHVYPASRCEVAGCLQLLEILEISWNLKFLLEILEISWNFVDAPGKSS